MSDSVGGQLRPRDRSASSDLSRVRAARSGESSDEGLEAMRNSNCEMMGAIGAETARARRIREDHSDVALGSALQAVLPTTLLTATVGHSVGPASYFTTRGKILSQINLTPNG